MRDLRPTLVLLLGALLLTSALTALGATLAATQGDRPADALVDVAEPTSFIAFARDFRDFRSWERHHVPGAMMPVDAADGPTYVYLNRRAPPESRRWPIGTMVVKAIESGAPHEWTIHAMVKRGIPFNADGALGWEYFELRFPAPSEEPVVVWRGGGPPSGHGYAAAGRGPEQGAVPLVCDDCHTAAWQNDSVLTPALVLRR